MKTFHLLLLILLLAINGCKDNPTEPQTENGQSQEETFVKVNVDLQYGFAGHVVIIEFNEGRNYYAILSNEVSLAGPEAAYKTFLPRGQNKLFVFLGDVTNHQNYSIDSTYFYLGDKDEYFIGLNEYDSVYVLVQDSTFFYL